MENLEKLRNEISLYTLEMIKSRGFGHLGGSFSIIDVLTVLFGKQMNINPKDPEMEDRDWFILSKGHAGPAYYATLVAKGYMPKDEIYTLNQEGTKLPSHPDRNLTVGVDVTTGSLGQGISQAVGVAYGHKLQNHKNYTYVIVGDGECNEGQVWEAFQFASNKKLDNLIIFIDNNKQQVDGYTKDISFEFDFEKMMNAMGFHTQQVRGRSLKEIDKAIDVAKQTTGRASVIILDTDKSQGLEDYVGKLSSHHLRLSDEDVEIFDRVINEYKEKLGDLT